jgi:Holliday junction resolvasome RuvABC endonuclease subunit
MRTLGLDYAKVGFSAAALAIDKAPYRCFVWQIADKRESEPEQLLQFAAWWKRILWVTKPDLVVVEELAVFLNKNSIRTLARREGVALLVAKQSGAVVIHPPVSQSRSIVLGSPGNMSKEEAWKRIKKRYPGFDFGHANQGGMDKGDAMTHALAGATILERR